MTTSDTRSGLAALKDSDGAFKMLAIDQRESLRGMLAAGSGRATATDDELVDFKTTAAQILTPHATAVLLDYQYGLGAIRAAKCPVILAADLLYLNKPGGIVNRAAIDPDVTAELIADTRPAALKMLVPWLPEKPQEAIDLSNEFMELCRQAGLPGIVEGVVRPDDIATWSDKDRDDALVAAAADLAKTHPDLYKAEVPSYGKGDPEALTAQARRITDVLDSEWVILSSGVTPDDFPGAVEACMRGGATGFLAGRAVWADALKQPNPADSLETNSVQRLNTLADVAARTITSTR